MASSLYRNPFASGVVILPIQTRIPECIFASITFERCVYHVKFAPNLSISSTFHQLQSWIKMMVYQERESYEELATFRSRGTPIHTRPSLHSLLPHPNALQSCWSLYLFTTRLKASVCSGLHNLRQCGAWPGKLKLQKLTVQPEELYARSHIEGRGKCDSLFSSINYAIHGASRPNVNDSADATSHLVLHLDNEKEHRDRP